MFLPLLYFLNPYTFHFDPVAFKTFPLDPVCCENVFLTPSVVKTLGNLPLDFGPRLL